MTRLETPPKTAQAHKKRRKTQPFRPVTVTIHAPLLDAVRAAYPTARDWPNNRVTAACIAYTLKAARRPT